MEIFAQDFKTHPEIDAKITGSVTTTIPVSCEAPESIIENAVSIIPVAVNKHIRNLPDGWKASPKKIASATENGYILESGQTWVDNYTRGAIAA